MIRWLVAMGMMALMSIGGVASAQAVFSDTTRQDTVYLSGGFAAVSTVTVSASYTVTSITSILATNAPHNVRFFIYDLTGGAMVYISAPKAFPSDGGAFVGKESDLFPAVTLLPGRVYNIGGIADQIAGTSLANGTVTQGVVTNSPTNANFSNFSAPARYSSGGYRVNLRLNTIFVPSITAVSPAEGPLTGGSQVVITGSGFTGATSVTFGGTPATSFTVDNDNQITAFSPPGGQGVVDIVVSNPSRTSANTAADNFAYIAAVPTLSEWAMILFTAMLAGGAALHLQRRSRTI